MTPPAIQEFRLSMVMGCTILDPPPPDGGSAALPWHFATERDPYGDWFERLRIERRWDSVPWSTSPPWPGHAVQGFWFQFLSQVTGRARPLADISGRQAFDQWVPVRVAAPVRLSTPMAKVSLSVEGFVWPWGVGCMITARCREAITSLADLVQASLALRAGSYTDATGRAGTPEAHAAAVLRELSSRTFGPTAVGVPWSGEILQPWHDEPRTVHSVVRGSGDRAGFDPRTEEVHSVVQAVTVFSDDWQHDHLIDLERARVAERAIRAEDQIVYGAQRGIAIWAPRAFLGAPGEVTSTGCYHRNLALATLQTQSMLGFVRECATVAAGGGGLGVHEQRARRVTGSLAGLMNGGGYRSGAVRAQIVSGDNPAAINAIRAAAGEQAVTFA